MRPHGVVVTTPAFNDDLRLPQRVEDLAIEQLVAQPGIKTLDEPVLPRTARRDVGGLCSDGADPLLHRLGNELRAIIGTDMPGNAAQDEQVGEHVDDIDRLEPARYPNGQTFVGKFVDDVEHSEFASIMGALLDEVVRPDVVGALGPQPKCMIRHSATDARAWVAWQGPSA